MLVTKGPAFDSPWYMDQHTRMEASERSVLLDVLFILLVLIIPRWADQIIHQQLSCPLPRLFCSNKGKIDFPDWLARWKSFESLWWTTNFAMTSHLAKPLMHVAHPSIYPSSPIYQHTRTNTHLEGCVNLPLSPTRAIETNNTLPTYEISGYEKKYDAPSHSFVKVNDTQWHSPDQAYPRVLNHHNFWIFEQHPSASFVEYQHIWQGLTMLTSMMLLLPNWRSHFFEFF